jgi:hypothetical protein
MVGLGRAQPEQVSGGDALACCSFYGNDMLHWTDKANRSACCLSSSSAAGGLLEAGRAQPEQVREIENTAVCLG